MYLSVAAIYSCCGTMAFAKFIEKQIRPRPSMSMQQDQLGYTPEAEESGIASSFLTFVSMVLIVITFPFSLFFCMRMIQVSGRELQSQFYLIKLQRQRILVSEETLTCLPVPGIRAGRAFPTGSRALRWTGGTGSLLHHSLHRCHRRHRPQNHLLRRTTARDPDEGQRHCRGRRRSLLQNQQPAGGGLQRHGLFQEHKAPLLNHAEDGPRHQEPLRDPL